MKRKEGYIQQGDVLFHREPFPTDTASVTKLRTSVIQEGEHTGHAHRLVSGEYEFVEVPDTKARHLRVITPTLLKHEEHAPIELPPGEYRIGIVREYDHFEEEARYVRD